MDEVATILEKLGFSFWQLILIFIVIYFRKEAKNLINRVVNVKIGENEINLSAEKDFVMELTLLQERLLSESTTPKDTRKFVKNIIDSKVLQSIANIRKYTYELWEEFKKNREKGCAVSIKIPSLTLARIKKDLEILDAARYLRFHLIERDKDKSGSDTLYQLRIDIVSDEFGELLDKLE